MSDAITSAKEISGESPKKSLFCFVLFCFALFRFVLFCFGLVRFVCLFVLFCF